MTPAMILEEARAAGVELSATPQGKIRWRCRGPLTESLRQEIVHHKGELISLLLQGPAFHWNAAAAEELLADLYREVEGIKADFGGVLPVPLGDVLADALEIGAGYVRDHQVETARNWDPLKLLRGMVPHVRCCVENWKWLHPTSAFAACSSGNPCSVSLIATASNTNALGNDSCASESEPQRRLLR